MFAPGPDLPAPVFFVPPPAEALRRPVKIVDMVRPMEEKVREIVRRIVEVANPETVILFGSVAKGDVGEASDVDLLVVKAGAHRRKLAMAIYSRLAGVGCAVDVIVVTPEDIARYGGCFALVIEPAVREGRVVHAA
jgi:uncharacterized protein